MRKVTFKLCLLHRRLVFLLVLIPCLYTSSKAGVYLANFVRRADRSDSSSMPLIRITPETLNFKETWESTAFRWDVVFENVMDKPVLLYDVEGGCKCVKTTGGKEITLNPGERATIRCDIDSTQLRPHDPDPIRSVGVELRARAGYNERQLTAYRWRLEGKVRRFLTCKPHEVGLSEELVRGVPGRFLEIKIHPNAAIRKLQLKKVPNGWKAEVKKSILNEDEYILQAKPCKSVIGLFEDVFEIEAMDTKGRDIPIQRINVMGNVTENIAVFPEFKDLGEIRVKAVAHANISVTARSGEPIEVVKVITTDPLVNVNAIHRGEDTWTIELERMIVDYGVGESSGIVRAKSHKGITTDAEFRLRWYGVSTAN